MWNGHNFLFDNLSEIFLFWNGCVNILLKFMFYTQSTFPYSWKKNNLYQVGQIWAKEIVLIKQAKM